MFAATNTMLNLSQKITNNKKKEIITRPIKFLQVAISQNKKLEKKGGEKRNTDRRFFNQGDSVSHLLYQHSSSESHRIHLREGDGIGIGMALTGQKRGGEGKGEDETTRPAQRRGIERERGRDRDRA